MATAAQILAQSGDKIYLDRNTIHRRRWNNRNLKDRAVGEMEAALALEPGLSIAYDWLVAGTDPGLQWDMGHTPGNEYAELHARYMHGEISLEEFLGHYRNPVNFVPESPSANRSHRYQDH